MKTVHIVHGWYGNPDGEWRPWLKKILLQKGWRVEIPAMPNSRKPEMNAWVKHLKKTIPAPDKNTVLIGHSLGVITILRYLESLKPAEKIGAAILIAGFSYDLEYDGYHQELGTFFRTSVNFAAVKKHCHNFTVLHSQDDPWVPIKHAYLFREKLGARIIIQNGMKHYSGDDGVYSLPIVAELLETIF
ncbi:serine hydrolase family protein [Candidatus Roizmanbacteria bacterium]|nr:serine hydrolase family protein [Candidatus Roizmanbacteria bacterium]